MLINSFAAELKRIYPIVLITYQSKEMAISSKILLITALFILILYVYLLIGEGQELIVWESTPNTLDLYATSDVCVETIAKDDTDTPSVATKSTKTLAENARKTNESDQEQHQQHILNCGHCGKCSNRHDIQIYKQTRVTLTGMTTECTKGGVLRGLDTNYVKECLRRGSELSLPCVDCWVLNVGCNWKHCFKTCIKHKLAPFRWLPSLYHRSHKSPVDPCLECDERMCGPKFIECAGANRRRVGVVSDIQRNVDLELCDKVDWNWIDSRTEEDEAETEDAVHQASGAAEL